jgi:hypothetical protein
MAECEIFKSLLIFSEPGNKKKCNRFHKNSFKNPFGKVAKMIFLSIVPCAIYPRNILE